VQSDLSFSYRTRTDLKICGTLHCAGGFDVVGAAAEDEMRAAITFPRLRIPNVSCSAKLGSALSTFPPSGKGNAENTSCRPPTSDCCSEACTTFTMHCMEQGEQLKD
jgi:hypothetical protein